MGWYWRRSTKLLPGVRINWSKSGPSLSVGPRGAKVSVGKRGTYVSGGIPGTGMYYRQRIGGNKGNTSIYDAASNTNGNSSKSVVSKKGCLITLFAIISLVLLLTRNFITLLIFAAICSCIWLIVYLKKHKQDEQSIQSSQQNLCPPDSSSQQISSNHTATTSDSSTQPQSGDFNVHDSIVEIEHLMKDIDKCSDKVKLPSYYRKLIAIIMKLEKYDNITIQGMSVEETKQEVLENYRKKMQ